MTHWLYTDKLWTLGAWRTLCAEGRDAGLDGMLLRLGYRYGVPAEGLINSPTVIAQAVDIAREHGLGVGAWFWPHPLHLEAQRDVMASQLREWEPYWLVCDAEGEAIWRAGEGLGRQLCADMRELSDAPRVLTSLSRLPRSALLQGPWEVISPQLYTRTRAEMVLDVARWREVLGEEPRLVTSSGLYRKRADGGNIAREHEEVLEHLADHASLGVPSTFMWGSQWWRASRHAAAVRASGMCGPA